jgi:cell filamentation protein
LLSRTRILKNIPGLRNRSALERFEAIATTQRADEPLPRGRLGVTHYRTIHRHLFQDVFEWAGHFRTVALSKEGSVFCYPAYVPHEMEKLFGRLKEAKLLKGLPLEKFLPEAAHFLAELNAIHPFREGNGRTQTTFLVLLATKAGRARRPPFVAPETLPDCHDRQLRWKRAAPAHRTCGLPELGSQKASILPLF